MTEKESAEGKSPLAVFLAFISIGIGLVGTIILIILIHLLIEGIVTMYLWQWLIVPTFHVNALSLASSIGLTLFVSMLTIGQQQNKPKSENPGTDLVTHIIVKPIIYLIIGYIISLYIS